jgi:formamidopyrimidine-DNA glycosylase
LDQRALAGVGNLYASEILHRARIHPAAPCCSLRPAAWRALCARIHEVLEEAIACEGSTLADGTYRNTENRVGWFQHRHRVYQRHGLPCLRCGTPVVRIVQAQRSTFFCPRCQPVRP